MNCTRTRALLAAAFDEASPTPAEAAQHCLECLECAAYAGLLNRLDMAIYDMPMTAPSAQCAARIMAGVQADNGYWPRWVTGRAVSQAALFLALTGGLVYFLWPDLMDTSGAWDYISEAPATMESIRAAAVRDWSALNAFGRSAGETASAWLTGPSTLLWYAAAAGGAIVFFVNAMEFAAGTAPVQRRLHRHTH